MNYQDIRYLLIAALGGGSNHWIKSVDSIVKFGDWYTNAVDTGFYLTDLHDATYDIRTPDYEQALERLSRFHPKVYDRIINKTYDARDADNWLQTLIFNDIIYE